MTRIVDRRVEWERQNGQGLRFRWRGTWHCVRRTVDIWRDTGAWWEGEEEKIFFRVESTDGGCFELYRPLGRGAALYLYRIYD